MLWIERHTHQYPLTLHSVQNSYHEAMKSHDFFGDSKHGFCDRFALGIEFSIGFGLHMVRPCSHRIGVFGASDVFSKTLFRRWFVMLAIIGQVVRINACLLELLGVIF